jgi:hypothetical protein
MAKCDSCKYAKWMSCLEPGGDGPYRHSWIECDPPMGECAMDHENEDYDGLDFDGQPQGEWDI